MNVDTALNRFNKLVTPSATQRRIADARAEHFARMLREIEPGVRVVRAGSWVRDTSLGPIHDVDLIVVFPADLHPDWDAGSGTAQLALEQVKDAIQERLQTHYGLSYVWRTELRNHVVKCYIDSRTATESPTAKGFSVEVMPAIRSGSTFRVPERRDDRWRTVDPEHLRKESAARQREWRHYTAMVRLLKHWAREHPELHITPLAMEVLALKCLPHPPLLARMTRTEALKRFFTAAAAEVMKGVRDPAGRCGEIAPNLKRKQARDEFLKMADLAATAEEWEKSGHEHGHDIAVHYLRLILGKKFPKPSRDWSDIDAEPWWQRWWVSPEYRRYGGERLGPPWTWAPGWNFGPGNRPGDPGNRPGDAGDRPGDPGDGSDGPPGPGPGPRNDPGDPPRGPGGGTGVPRPPDAGPHPRGPGDGPGVIRPPHVRSGSPTDSGVSLRNPNGHRAAMPVTPIAAPSAPRPEDPAG